MMCIVSKFRVEKIAEKWKILKKFVIYNEIWKNWNTSDITS